MALTVLMNAGPWLPVPPLGYGGIENVIATLVPELRRRGVRVVMATVGTSTVTADEHVSVFAEGQFGRLLDPYNRVSGVPHAHLQGVLAELRGRGDVDLVHDHVEVVGPSTLAAADVPTLHTLHWDLGRHAPFYANLDCRDAVWVNGVSADQLGKAPDPLRQRVLGHVHLATPLADGAEHRRLPAKADHVVVLGRITHAKGQHIAVRVARELGWPLVLAGPVGPFRDAEDLRTGLAARPELRSTNPDVRYFCEQISDHVDGRHVRWAGTLHGEDLTHLIATARAALTPITWDEPGGTAVVESLALGTPVVGFRRGCLPELISHGRTGLLATPGDEADLAEQLLKSPYLDPAACVQEAVERFRPAVMAENYLRLYRKVLDHAG